MGLSKMMKNTKIWTKNHTSDLLTSLGIGCFAVGAILVIPATIKAIDLIEEEKETRLDHIEGGAITEACQFTVIDYVKTCWKVYSPSTLLIFLGGVCVINANRINVKRTAALTAAYTISETTLREFKNKAVEVVGEKKVDEIKQEVIKDKYESNPIQDRQIIISPYQGEALFCDGLTMRYFRMNIDNVKKAENRINLIMRNDNYCSVNELYDFLGLEHTDLGRMLGWNIDRDGYVEIITTPQIASNGEPCIYLEFSEMPKYEYSKLEY